VAEPEFPDAGTAAVVTDRDSRIVAGPGGTPVSPTLKVLAIPAFATSLALVET
jgi:hypothetical protein